MKRGDIPTRLTLLLIGLCLALPSCDSVTSTEFYRSYRALDHLKELVEEHSFEMSVWSGSGGGFGTANPARSSVTIHCTESQCDKFVGDYRNRLLKIMRDGGLEDVSETNLGRNEMTLRYETLSQIGFVNIKSILAPGGWKQIEVLMYEHAKP